MEEENNRNVMVVMGEENNRNVVVVKEGTTRSKPIYMPNILPFSRSTLCSWEVDMSLFCSVCKKSSSRKDSMQRHVMAKQRKACLIPFQTVAMSSKNMSVFLLGASFHLHGCRDYKVWKDSLGSIFITASFRGNLPSPERIVWCYSQWQPVYTKILVAMPYIEFVKGIPTALE